MIINLFVLLICSKKTFSIYNVFFQLSFFSSIEYYDLIFSLSKIGSTLGSLIKILEKEKMHKF